MIGGVSVCFHRALIQIKLGSSWQEAKQRDKKERRIMIAIVLLGLILSGIDPYDRPTWWMEFFPVLIGLPILILTYDRFPLTPLSYRLITIHALILMLGGHYTYARVPLGFWIQDLFNLRGTITIASGTSHKGLFRRSLHGKFFFGTPPSPLEKCSSSLSPASVLRSAPLMSSSNGGRQSPAGKRPMLFWVLRGMSGIPNGICSSP